MEVNPVRELHSFTPLNSKHLTERAVCANGDIKPPAAFSNGVKCDLVLLSWNNLNILKECVESIFRCARVPSRLVVVDNGSCEKGLKDYLLSLKSNDVIDVNIILNAKNEGFAAGMNKGMSLSEMPYVCILNNDLIVTDGWLEEMIRVAEENPVVGIINPSSNNFGLRFGKDATLEEFARGLKSESGRWVEMNACIGFCMLVKREVIKKIGYFGEEYGYAYFEDTDFSRRAQAAGYKCAMANGCYVYHAEGKSGKFLKSKDAQFRKSAEIFYGKWGKPLRVVCVARKNGKDLSARLIERVNSELAAHNRVWLFQEESADVSNLPRHLDLMITKFSKKFFNLRAFWNIIKKKKRFDRLYIGNTWLRALLAPYCWIRKAEIRRL
ncbi:MAG: glycosyltransferase family 2 protein [Candidatus Omnitrophota bacterium]